MRQVRAETQAGESGMEKPERIARVGRRRLRLHRVSYWKDGAAMADVNGHKHDEQEFNPDIYTLVDVRVWIIFIETRIFFWKKLKK
mgnify:CR=1 FL=1